MRNLDRAATDLGVPLSTLAVDSHLLRSLSSMKVAPARNQRDELMAF